MATPERSIMLVIAAGGGAGSVLRYAAGRGWPDSGRWLPWTTLSINLLGSLLLGMLVVAVTELWRPHPLVRPLLGTGVLGGFTTFSTFAVQVRALAAGPALGYLALSVAGGLLAAATGMAPTRRCAATLARPGPTGAGRSILVDPTDPDLP
ncbi:MAG: fluoride efflux transporter FluC [Jatrophihabitans sp.]